MKEGFDLVCAELREIGFENRASVCDVRNNFGCGGILAELVAARHTEFASRTILAKRASRMTVKVTNGRATHRNDIFDSVGNSACATPIFLARDAESEEPRLLCLVRRGAVAVEAIATNLFELAGKPRSLYRSSRRIKAAPAA